MLSSKANAALTRLREIEEKYKMKRIEQKWNRKEESDSSISSISVNLSENLSAQVKDSPKNVSKLKLNIKMPDTRFEGHTESMKPASQNKVLNETSPRFSEVIDLQIAAPLEDKSPRSARKQESVISDIITILENSSIESILNDSMISSKSLSRSKTSRQFSTINNTKSSKREEKAKADRKSDKEKSDKSDISRKELSNYSSSARRSKLSERSNDQISKTHSDLKSREYLTDEKEIVRTSKITNSRRNSKISNNSGSSRDDSVIDESINTLENGSEIISEFSPAEESMTGKTEDRSANIPNSPKHSVPENGYANDTFENVSSSTVRSKSDRREWQNYKMIDGKKETVNLTGSRIDQIAITPRKKRGSYQDDAKSHRNEQIIEPIASNTMRSTSNCKMVAVNEEPSNHVKNLKKIDANTDNATLHSLKSLGSSNSDKQKEKQKRYQIEKNVSKGMDDSKITLDSSTVSDSAEESLIDDMTRTDDKVSRRKSSPQIRKISVSVSQQEDGREEREKASDGASERAMMDVTGLPVVDNAERIELAKPSSSRGEDTEIEEDEDVLVNNSERQISWDAEYPSKLRKSHEDMIDMIKQTVNLKTMKKACESSSGHKTECKLRDTVTTTTNIISSKKGEYHFSEKIDCNNRKYNNIKKKERIAKVTNSKSVEARNTSGSHRKDKPSKCDRKQTYRLQRQTVELRLRQEREDLQKYLHELKDLRLGLGTDFTRSSYFSPLEFPKIAEFAQSDSIHLESKPDNQRVVLQERVSAIRRWLKDQYILYRDYCTMAQAINAHYVPTTLEDAKKAMRELEKAEIEIK